MPEFVDASMMRVAGALIDKKEELHKERDFFTNAQMEEIVKKEDLQFIARGGECVVIAPRDHSKPDLPLRDDIVIATDFEDIENNLESKKIFYAHRIMSTLFPHNFPRFFTSYGSSAKAEKSGTIRQRIYEMQGEIKDEDIKYPLDVVDEATTEMGELPIKIDPWSSKNFIVGKDGGEYYVDKIRLDDKPVWHTDKILAYMEKNKYDPIDQRIVIRSIARLQELTNPQES